jgi:hypothetical protein
MPVNVRSGLTTSKTRRSKLMRNVEPKPAGIGVSMQYGDERVSASNRVEAD